MFWKTEDPKNIPQVIDGSALLGTRAFGTKWANGYEALASLDSNKDGQLVGTELSNLWIWVDANTNALVDPGEAKAAASYVKALNTVATVHPSGDAEAPKGAVLQSGAMVPSWDWWSATPAMDAVVRSDGRVQVAPKVMGTSPDKAVVYVWGKGDEVRGLLRFIAIGQDSYVVSLPFTASPSAGFFPCSVGRIHHSSAKPGKLEWKLQSNYGGVSELAFVEGTPLRLNGVNGREAMGTRESYSWEAVPMSGTMDETLSSFLRAITGFTETQFAEAVAKIGDETGSLRVLGGVDISKVGFAQLPAF